MSALAEHGTDGTGQGGGPVQAGHDGARPRTPRRRGRTVVLVAVAAAVAAAAVLGVVAFTGKRPHPPPSHPLRGTVFRLRPGQCLNSAHNGVNRAHAVPCAQPHDAEIYGAFSVAGHRWPGAAALAERAHTGCLGRLGSYLNPQLATTGMSLSYIYPDQGAWAAGERMVICEVRGTHGRLTGSVRAFSGSH